MLRGRTVLALRFQWQAHVRLWVRLNCMFDDERKDRVLVLGRVASEHVCAHKGPEWRWTAIAYDIAHTRTHTLNLTDGWMDEWVDGALIRLVQSPANTTRKQLWRGKHVWTHRTTISCDLAHATRKHASKHAHNTHKHTHEGGRRNKWMDDALVKLPQKRTHIHMTEPSTGRRALSDSC